MSKLWSDKKKQEKIALKESEEKKNNPNGPGKDGEEETTTKKTKTREKSNSLSNSGLFKAKKSNRLKACLKTNPNLNVVLRLVCFEPFVFSSFSNFGGGCNILTCDLIFLGS